MKGVYKIINKVNNKFYLGSSVNCNTRKSTHFSQLKNNKHHCIHLQRSYNKYGKDYFQFEIIEECVDCFKEEQKWLDSLNWDECFNISKFAGGGDNLTNHPNRDEIIKKLTQILNNNRHKIKPKYKDKNGNWKGGVSTTKCLSCDKIIRTPSKYCSECYFEKRDIKGEKNPFYNKKHTLETKEKIKHKLKERGYVGKQERKVIVNDTEYKSVSEASREFKVTPNTIINRIRNKNFKNYKYK